jgi:hypothetical protein
MVLAAFSGLCTIFASVVTAAQAWQDHAQKRWPEVTARVDSVVGPYVLLGNQKVVYLVPGGSFTVGKPYSEMERKLVAATGHPQVFSLPDAEPADQVRARPRDYFTLRRSPLNCGLLAIDAS